MSTSASPPAKISYRPMLAKDIGRVPMDCHGDAEAVTARVRDLGAAAILAFDGAQHVGQLQFRRHDPALRSATGIWSPDYWGDFGDDQPELPGATLGVFCYHVGQLTDGDERDERYFGRGIGIALLDFLIDWAKGQGFRAMVAKSTPPHRAVMGFMGGQPAHVYEENGFELCKSWIDPQLQETVQERQLVPDATDVNAIARVGMCVKHFQS